jgi:transposase InsO family protein
MVEKQIENSIKILCSDQWGGYTLGKFIKYCKDHGLVHQFTLLHTPQENGVAKRKNKTLV